MSREHNERLIRNDASLPKATHHREPWSATEDEWLSLWAGGEAELAEIAEILGRTIEACRERFYKARRGMTPDYVQRVTIERITIEHQVVYRPTDVCPVCFTVRAANGSCGCTE